MAIASRWPTAGFAHIGSIEARKDADPLPVDGDVATDITDIERPILVVRAGRAYDPQKLVDATSGAVGKQ